jgi:4-hydroxy-3-polyprenylbenzoate decarboxylase
MNPMGELRSVTIAMTGASGTIYGLRTIEEMLSRNMRVSAIYTKGASEVSRYELGIDLERWLEEKSREKNLRTYYEDELDAPISSSSSADDAVVVVPCSIKTLAQIAYGIAENLVVRASLNALRLRRPLVLVPRETPLGSAELKAMLAAHEAGATILPAMPSFYIKPKSIDDMVNFVVGKIFDVLGIQHSLYKKWRSDEESTS